MASRGSRVNKLSGNRSNEVVENWSRGSAGEFSSRQGQNIKEFRE